MIANVIIVSVYRLSVNVRSVSVAVGVSVSVTFRVIVVITVYVNRMSVCLSSESSISVHPRHSL